LSGLPELQQVAPKEVTKHKLEGTAERAGEAVTGAGSGRRAAKNVAAAGLGTAAAVYLAREKSGSDGA